ncbi:hypothetical protein DFH27DRAFT_83436 [Peziza echinospora]|nr:hypothetical protein DFH27DRAFT_83436 [Peziza echinospora]
MSKSKIHVYLRAAQFAFPIIILILVGYSKAKPGYWEDMTTPLAVSILASVFTLALTLIHILPFTRTQSQNLLQHRLFSTMADVVIIVLWVGAAVTIFQPRKYYRVKDPQHPKNEHEMKQVLIQNLVRFQPPKTKMQAAGAFVVIEIIVSIAAAVMACMTDGY